MKAFTRVKILRVMIVVLVALSIGLGPSLMGHAIASSAGVPQAAATPPVAASHEHAHHDLAAPDTAMTSAMDGDCHGMKRHGNRGDVSQSQDVPQKGCCADGKSCAATLCLAKCFHLLAVLAPADARLAFSVAHVPILAFTLPSDWTYGPAPPPPRA